MIRRFAAQLIAVLVAAALAGCGGAASGDFGKDTISVETQPALLESGRRATVTIRVTDSAGQPVKGAKVNFKAQHKTMSHSPDANAAADEREPGVYSSAFLPSMSGTYRLTVSVDRTGAKSQKSLDTEVQG